MNMEYQAGIICMILFQNVLVQCGLVSVPTHCKTALLYIVTQMPHTLTKNPLRYSMTIHHIVAMYMLIGGILHHEYANVQIMLVESSTLFALIHKGIRTEVTNKLRTWMWIMLRTIFLPSHVIYELYRASQTRYDILINYGHAYMTILILSLEWTNKAFKLGFTDISLLYYIIPSIHCFLNYEYICMCMIMSYVTSYLVLKDKRRFEDKMISRLLQTYMLSKMYIG